MLIFPHKSKADIEAGFSLLEMLVVLAIMGVVLSMVGLRLSSTIESTRFVKTAESAMEDIRLMRLRALLDEKATVIVTSQFFSPEENAMPLRLERLNVPEDWTVSGDNISISTTGYCTGGRIHISDNKGRNISFDLYEGSCDAQRL